MTYSTNSRKIEFMKAAIYVRVSTSDQHNEIQIKELTDCGQSWATTSCTSWLDLSGFFSLMMAQQKNQSRSVQGMVGTVTKSRRWCALSCSRITYCRESRTGEDYVLVGECGPMRTDRGLRDAQRAYATPVLVSGCGSRRSANPPTVMAF